MTENSPEYINEDLEQSQKPSFIRSRGFKISAITIGSALALAGSFGAGVVAGHKIGSHESNDAFGNHQFGDQKFVNGQLPGNGQFPGGKAIGPGKGFPGKGFGPGADDPDHGAGTDIPGAKS